MILATSHGNRESRGFPAGTTANFTGSDGIPRASSGAFSHSGRRVGFGDAVGIPAVMRAFRLLSETVGQMPLQVVAEEADGRQEPLRTAPEWPLLHDVPNPPYGTAMATWSYAIVCMLRGGVVFQKLRAQRLGLIGLEPIAPHRYGGKPVWEDGHLVVKVRNGRDTVTLRCGTGGEALYVPGILLDDPYIGVGVIEAMRHALGNPLARQEFEGRYIANDGGVNIVLKHDGDPDPAQRRAIRDGFEDRHRGKPGRPAMMWGGWDLQKLGLTLEDAQFIESQKFTVQDVARMFGAPARKLGDTEGAPPSDPAQDDRDLLTYGVGPLKTQLEQGLHADGDVFPIKSRAPKFLVDGLMRADPDKRNGAYLKARQAGWMSANEIRKREGLAPVDGGDELQLTPVGGAANPDSTPSKDDTA